MPPPVLPTAPPPPALPASEELPRAPVTPTATFNVFDVMSGSLDDDEFMANMNIGSYDYMSQSQDYDTQVGDTQLDGGLDDEGFIDEMPKGRRANYTTAEDLLLVKAWQKVGMDAAVGTDQPKALYWVRIKGYFDEHNQSGNERTTTFLRHCWSTVFLNCQKWSGCLSYVQKLNPSGTNDCDRHNIAIKAFKGKPKKSKKGKLIQGKAFTLSHCWQSLSTMRSGGIVICMKCQ
ncbi:uncharacterized protein LOC104581761 [Brachypodium distachyon]|nr:uncharacterized protein LOC104581761 [Brachypodium distachyon]|eukprot:XP_010228504.1 uncharacterized protein LOC104581761 [Brachypodium distachyon]